MLTPGAIHDAALVMPVEAARAEVFADLARLIVRLRDEHPRHAPSFSLHAGPAPGEWMLLCRIASPDATPSLRRRISVEAERLGGRLLEPQALGQGEQRAFQAVLAASAARVDVEADVDAAIGAFRLRLGLVPGPAVWCLEHDSQDALAARCARLLIEGCLEIELGTSGARGGEPGAIAPVRAAPEPGASIELEWTAPGLAPMRVPGLVVESDAAAFRVEVESTEALRPFVAKRVSLARAGQRRRPEGGRRQTGRVSTCLDVEVLEALPGAGPAWISDLSRAGAFVRAERTMPIGAALTLRLAPGGAEAATVPARVVHQGSGAEASTRGAAGGFGVAFAPGTAQGPLERALARLSPRRPRVLLVDDDPHFARVLSDELVGHGLDVVPVLDGATAPESLGREVLGADLLILDLRVPGFDSRALLERLRRLGAALDLRVLALEEPSRDGLGAGGAEPADATLRKGAPLASIVGAALRLLAL